MHGQRLTELEPPLCERIAALTFSIEAAHLEPGCFATEGVAFCPGADLLPPGAAEAARTSALSLSIDAAHFEPGSEATVAWGGDGSTNRCRDRSGDRWLDRNAASGFERT